MSLGAISVAPDFGYKCPACGGGLRHRAEARFGKYECLDCHRWIDEGPDGYVVVDRLWPRVPVEALKDLDEGES